MVEITTINPRFVFVSNTQPADVGIGKIWVNTSTNPPTTLVSNGTTYNPIAQDLTTLKRWIGLNALNIIDLTARASLTAGTNANFQRDVYSDNNGYLNTINLAQTTAMYNSSIRSYISSQITNLNLPASFDGTTTTGPLGVRFEVSQTILFRSFRIVLPTTNIGAFWNLGTTNGGTQIASGNTGGVGGSVNINVNLSPGTYFLTISNAGLTHGINTALASYPYTTGAVSVVSASDGTTLQIRGCFNELVFEHSTPPNTHIQTNPQTIQNTFSNFMIVSNEATTGTGNVRYNISFNNGVNFQNNLLSFTQYPILNNGTQLILRQLLNSQSAGDSASVQNWGVLLW